MAKIPTVSTVILLLAAYTSFSQTKVYKSKFVCYSSIVRDAKTDKVISRHDMGCKDQPNMFVIRKDSILWYDERFENECKRFKIHHFNNDNSITSLLYRTTDAKNIQYLFAVSTDPKDRVLTVTTETRMTSFIIE